MQNYYSTQPFLAWVLNTYFFRGAHYTYVAPFYPYRLPNPRSSNPYEIYAQLYAPVKDADEYDKFVAQMRVGLRKGVMAKEKAGAISPETAAALEEACDKASLRFFWPIIYRVDIDAIDHHRRHSAGSAQRGSVEYLLTDLAPDEFDILFFDYTDDPELSAIFERTVTSATVLQALQNSYASAT